MRIRVELASGRAVEGTVPPSDEEAVRSILNIMPGYLSPHGWLRVYVDEGDEPSVVSMAQVETITELRE